jgi:hypothetical protein
VIVAENNTEELCGFTLRVEGLENEVWSFRAQEVSQNSEMKDWLDQIQSHLKASLGKGKAVPRVENFWKKHD